MDKIYFISDAHLGLGTTEEEHKKENRLLSFLDFIKRDATQLFILGDLFNAWFEYRTVIPKGFHRILAKLGELSCQGITIHFLVGNHDCWIRDYFRNELHLKTYHHPFEVTINGKNIFLHHGDGLANNDTKYKIMKKILRNRFAVWFYSWLHPDLGIKIARFSAKTSRRYSSNKHLPNDDGMEKYAEQKFQNGCDFVIMGHLHYPYVKKYGDGTYINLGDWINHNTYAVMDGSIIELKEWRA